MFVPSTKVVVPNKKYYPFYTTRLLAKKRYLWHERFSLNGMSKYETRADKCKRSIMKYQASNELKLTTNKNYGRAFHKYLNSNLVKSNTIPTLTDKLACI